jgi:hypothetical protein
MSQILQPIVTGNSIVDSWSFSVSDSNNELDNKLKAVLAAMQNLSNSSTTDQLRDAIIDALS